MRALRPDQTEALDNLRTAIANNDRHIVMQAPTGYGKTVLSAALVDGARRKNKKVLFCVPAISLIDQTVEMFASQGVTDVGVIQQNHHQTDGCMPVQVASIQTLQKREMPACDVVVIDEVHRWFEPYGKWMRDPAQWLHKPVIGLSATPWHKILGVLFTKLIKASTTQELIDKGLLSDIKKGNCPSACRTSNWSLISSRRGSSRAAADLHCVLPSIALTPRNCKSSSRLAV